MNVLFVTAEADPFAKVGGLADVAGSLPKALRATGVDARVIMPLYAFIDHGRWGITYLLSFDVHRRTGTIHVDLYTTTHQGVPIYFVRALPYFGQETTVYSNWDYDVPRYMFFCQAALDAANALRDQQGWFPDIFHVHDWHTGLVPFMVNQRRGDWGWGHVGTMLTIHNMQYQGEHIGGWAWEQGIPGRDHPELQARGLGDNMLAISIAYSDMITSVSPRYTVEIQYPYLGFGLQDLIRTRLPDLRGILNGIDMQQWNPATDPMLDHKFSADDFAEKRILNKRQLQAEANLEVRDDIPVIGMVSRLVQQKGLDLALPALRTILARQDVQFIGLGSGEPEYNEMFYKLGADFHWKAKCFLGYNAAVAQHIYAGCDIFLMPSHFEPCGIGQMLSMRYGALPLVRETGGLADTVQNYDDRDADYGTGFVFSWEEPTAVVGTLDWALWTYRNRPTAWRRMQERAMRVDFSWDKSAREYNSLYGWIQDRHR